MDTVMPAAVTSTIASPILPCNSGMIPYQTDIYVKCLQVSVTYLLQYCNITATRSTINGGSYVTYLFGR
jgi:hypothetical protein